MRDEWTDTLSEYVDGELGWRRRRRLEAHLRACRACAATVEELRAVVSEARRVPDRPPVEDLWPGIAARLAPRPAPERASWWRSLRDGGLHVHLTLPQLAGAAVLVIAIVSAAVLWRGRSPQETPSPATTADAGSAAAPAASTTAPAGSPDVRSAATAPAADASAAYEAAMTDLEQILEQEQGRLDARTIEVFKRSLATIDRAINEAREALAREPGDEFLKAHLNQSQRKKLELLRRTAAMVSAS